MPVIQEALRGEELFRGVITLAGEAVRSTYKIGPEENGKLLLPNQVIGAGSDTILAKQRELPEKGSLIYQGLIRAGFADDYLRKFYFLTKWDAAVMIQDGPTQWNPLSPEYRVSNDLKRDLAGENEKKRTAEAVNLGLDVIKFNLSRLAKPTDLPQEPYKSLMESNIPTEFFQAIKDQAPNPQVIDQEVFGDTENTAYMFLQDDSEIFMGVGALVCMVFSRATLPAVEYRIGHRLEFDTLLLLAEGPERSLLSKLRDDLHLDISIAMRGDILNEPQVVRKRKEVRDYYRKLGLTQPERIFNAFRDSKIPEITHAKGL